MKNLKNLELGITVVVPVTAANPQEVQQIDNAIRFLRYFADKLDLPAEVEEIRKQGAKLLKGYEKDREKMIESFNKSTSPHKEIGLWVKDVITALKANAQKKIEFSVKYFNQYPNKHGAILNISGEGQQFNYQFLMKDYGRDFGFGLFSSRGHKSYHDKFFETEASEKKRTFNEAKLVQFLQEYGYTDSLSKDQSKKVETQKEKEALREKVSRIVKSCVDTISRKHHAYATLEKESRSGDRMDFDYESDKGGGFYHQSNKEDDDWPEVDGAVVKELQTLIKKELPKAEVSFNDHEKGYFTLSVTVKGLA